MPVPKEQEGVLKYKPNGASDSQDGNTKGGDDEDEDGGVKVQSSSDYEKHFKLLGFTPMSKVPRQNFMAGVDIILPVRGAKNERAFAAMVNAMIEG